MDRKSTPYNPLVKPEIELQEYVILDCLDKAIKSTNFFILLQGACRHTHEWDTDIYKIKLIQDFELLQHFIMLYHTCQPDGINPEMKGKQLIRAEMLDQCTSLFLEFHKTEIIQQWAETNVEVLERPFEESLQNLWDFKCTLMKLRELIHYRFISPFRYRISENVLKKLFRSKKREDRFKQELQEKVRELTNASEIITEKLNIEIDNLRVELKKLRGFRKNRLQATEREGALSNMAQESQFQNELLEMDRIHESRRKEAHEETEALEREKRNCKSQIRFLENELKETILSYDNKMTDLQGRLNGLESHITNNEATILILHEVYDEVEERFEEMRITKRLREILQKLEMAENFKRNRAARVIQNAWRKYHGRKIRKLRRNAKLKRKPRIPGKSRKLTAS